jgi:hypothetical protein
VIPWSALSEIGAIWVDRNTMVAALWYRIAEFIDEDAE